MVRNFGLLAKHVLSLNKLNSASFEWPKGAHDGWTNPAVVKMIQDVGMCFTSVFDGCMLGVVSAKPSTFGQRIRKPWMVVTTSQSLTTLLSTYVCTGDHTHTPCAGSDTLKTGFYTKELATAIIQGLTTHALPAVPACTHESQTEKLREDVFDEDDSDLISERRFLTPRMRKHARKEAAKLAEYARKLKEEAFITKLITEIISTPLPKSNNSPRFYGVLSLTSSPTTNKPLSTRISS
jgi:hypothetical protein